MDKILVVYFSATGVTKRLAEKIANTLNADIFEIQPKVQYTNEDIRWAQKGNRAFVEMKNKKYRPGVLRKLNNADEYDTVFIGFPIWYDTAPTIVNTFLEENNLNGKNAYIFATSGATSVDRSLKDLSKAYPNISFCRCKKI